MRKLRAYSKFPGFKRYYAFNSSGGFIMYPTMLEQYWHQMSGSEQKCLDFILRQTIGWQKSQDSISWSQFEGGVSDTGNRGTGLSKSQIRRAVKRLEEMGFIKVSRHRSRPNHFKLVLDDDEYWEKLQGELQEAMHDIFKRDKK